VLHQVGAGTTGLVFRAYDPDEGRLVAIKAFRLDLTPVRAAELAGALQGLVTRGVPHPSIAAPIAAGVEDGVAWFAQAYVPAESLDTALRQYGPPPIADALTIVTQLAGALDFAAAAGVVHGALHPRDVLVEPGETHLVDLGVAAALESIGVRAPVRRPYSAPERAAGRPITREDDIFALGAIAFELLAGQPVTGSGDEAIATLPDIDGASRDALLETFSFALALAPDERYASGLAFAAPLKKALGDALTRPAQPRKRRATRPPEALLPVDEADPGSAAPDGPVDRAGDLARADGGPAEPVAGPANLPVSAVQPAMPESAPIEAGELSLSRPTLPEPSAPAVEPLLDVATSSETEPAAVEMRYPVEGSDASVSPLEAADLRPPAEPILRWSPDEGVVAAPPPSAVDREVFGRLDERQPPPAVHEPEEPGSTVNRHDAYEPTVIDEAAREPDRPAYTAWLPLAAMLVVGLVAGLFGGWMLFGGRGGQSSVPSTAAESAGATDRVQPRESTDVAVTEPGRSPSGGTAPASGSSTKPARAGSSAAPAAPRATPPVPAPAATPRPREAPSGRLRISTRPPGARVEVDGRNRGASPLTLTGLPYGRHTVRVVRDGYTAEERRVTLSARSPAQSVDVSLKRAARASTPASSPGGAASGAYVGSVVVESRPAGAQVFVDGRSVGVTPLSVPDVPIGSHVVRLELLGHKRWSTPIRVVAGERVRVAASLEEEALR
jgi:serine/threonine protein kinase